MSGVERDENGHNWLLREDLGPSVSCCNMGSVLTYRQKREGGIRFATLPRVDSEEWTEFMERERQLMRDQFGEFYRETEKGRPLEPAMREVEWVG